ncbi:hypothetical protein L9F63_000134, partial [Diploptera punctata]
MKYSQLNEFLANSSTLHFIFASKKALERIMDFPATHFIGTEWASESNTVPFRL